MSEEHERMRQLISSVSVNRLSCCAKLLKYRARATTSIAADAGLQTLSGFDYAIESTNCSRRVEALPAVAASF